MLLPSSVSNIKSLSYSLQQGHVKLNYQYPSDNIQIINNCAYIFISGNNSFKFQPDKNIVVKCNYQLINKADYQDIPNLIFKFIDNNFTLQDYDKYNVKNRYIGISRLGQLILS